MDRATGLERLGTKSHLIRGGISLVASADYATVLFR